MSKSLFQDLWRLWQAEALADEFRGVDPFQFMLCESEDVPWYQIDESVIILWKLREGWDAEMLTLNLHQADRDKVIPELHSIFDEYALQHLTASVPQPIRKTCRALHRLGFSMEGRIRDATVYEGILQDVDVLGIRKNEIPNSRPTRPSTRRGRKNRRPKRQTAQAGEVTRQGQEKATEVNAQGQA